MTSARPSATRSVAPPPPLAPLPLVLAEGVDADPDVFLALGRAAAGIARLATSGPASAPDIVLDLQGRSAAHGARIWRIVDAGGRCLLQPYFLADRCHRRPSDARMFLVESTDGANTWVRLAEAHPSAARSYRELWRVAGKTAAWLFAAGLRRPPGDAPPWQPTPSAGPGRAPKLRAAAATFAARLRDKLTGEIWAIGRFAGPAETLLRDRAIAAAHWITVPAADGFVADPFAWPGRPDMVLCERFFHNTGRGVLQALTVSDGRITGEATLPLLPDCHLSYPCAWSDGGRVLCLPEMAMSRRQVLYELLPDATLVEIAVIAEDVAMADATPFQHEGRWWIAYTDTDLGLHDNLNLVYADRPEGPWTPCQANPVKIDVRSTRCGGALFQAGGMLVRPAQDCSATYGGAIVLNRVDLCTPGEYRETPIARLTSDPGGPFPDGLHTVSVSREAIWIDAKREVLDPRIVLRRLVRRLGQAAAKVLAR